MTQSHAQQIPIWLWCLLAAFTLIWFGTLDYRHLIPSDEGRYAEIAREMFASGDWLTPRYNDYKYFEKPPLQAWMTAIAYKLFGVGAWQARLWTALTGYLTILMAGFTATKLYGRCPGISTSLILASSPLWVVTGHINALDMGLSACMGLTLFSFLLAQRTHLTPLAQRNWMLLCWASMAAAVLSKGLIGVVLPGLILITYSVIARDGQLWKRLHIGKGLLLFFLLSAPWFILVSLKNPEFVHFFFIHEHLARFTTDVHDRTEPLYFFIPLICAGFLPWFAQLPKAVSLSWQLPAQENGFRPTLLTLTWALFIFLFFSLSHSKLPGYILPIFPALALLAGQSLRQISQTAWHWQILLLGMLVVAGIFGLPRLTAMGYYTSEHAEFSAYTSWVALALTVMLAGCAGAWWLARDHALASVSTLAGSLFLTTMIAGTAHETLGRTTSGIDLAHIVKPLLRAEDPFYSLRRLDHTLPFYLEHPMIMVETTDELAFGAQQEPKKFVPTLAAFVQQWQQAPRAFALMTENTYLELQNMHVPMHEIARDRLRIIVSKQPWKSQHIAH